MNQIAFHKYFFCFPIKAINQREIEDTELQSHQVGVFYCHANERDDS